MTVRLYHNPLSGHAHRARLALSLLGVSHELVNVDFATRRHKEPAFLEINPLGQIPVLDDDGIVIPDSIAILGYLAAKYDLEGRWIPRDPVGAARVQAWFSVASGQIAFGPAFARRSIIFAGGQENQEAIARAHAILATVNGELNKRHYLVGAAATFADVALYSYIFSAPEGNVSLDGYAGIQAWLERVEGLPGFVPFQTTPVGLRQAP